MGRGKILRFGMVLGARRVSRGEPFGGWGGVADEETVRRDDEGGDETRKRWNEDDGTRGWDKRTRQDNETTRGQDNKRRDDEGGTKGRGDGMMIRGAKGRQQDETIEGRVERTAGDHRRRHLSSLSEEPWERLTCAVRRPCILWLPDSVRVLGVDTHSSSFGR
jgi:hypothetical protein